MVGESDGCGGEVRCNFDINVRRDGDDFDGGVVELAVRVVLFLEPTKVEIKKQCKNCNMNRRRREKNKLEKGVDGRELMVMWRKVIRK